MAEITIPNQEFLDGWKQGLYPGGLIRLESQLVDARIKAIGQEFEELTIHKQILAEQSGDNWHDGVFRASDEASLRISEQLANLNEVLHWPVVSLPDHDSTIASLGSRALLRLDGSELLCDIVGIASIHQQFYDAHPDEIEYATLGSPLGASVMGRSTGETFSATFGGRKRKLELIETQPSPDLEKR